MSLRAILSANLMRKTTPLFFFATSLVLFFLSSCSNPQNEAKQELASREYRFSNDEFLRAAGKGDIEALVLFGRAGMHVDAVNSRKRTALIEAAKQKRLDSVRLLIKAGADPHLKDLYGRDALIEAGAVGHVEIISLLLSQGVSPNVRDEAGWTAISLAAYHSHDEAVKSLVSRADQRQLEEALLLSAASGNVRSTSHLLKQGASTECRSAQHLTPLMVAAEKGHPDMVQFLITHRADVEARGKNAVTALSLATAKGHTEVVSLLHKNQALRKATVVSGRTLSAEEVAAKSLVALNGSTIRASDASSKNVMSAFEIHDFQEKSLPIGLNSVENDHAMLSRLRMDQAIPIRISVGQIIPGTRYRLEAVQPKDVQNRVLITHTETGTRHLLNKDRSLDLKDKTAVLISPQSRYRFVAKSGDIFKTVSGRNIETNYQVVKLTPTSVTLRGVENNELFMIR